MDQNSFVPELLYLIAATVVSTIVKQGHEKLYMQGINPMLTHCIENLLYYVYHCTNGLSPLLKIILALFNSRPRQKLVSLKVMTQI